MIGRFDAAINGVWLSEIDDGLVVTDIREHEPNTRTDTAGKHGAGTRFIRSARQSLSVTITFVLWEQAVDRRKDLLMRVQSWAMGAVGRVGHLEINDRRGQYLNVRVEELPPLASAVRWQEEISITFTAYELPWWLAQDAARELISESGLLYVPGTGGDALCDVSVRNSGNTTISRAQIHAGTSSMLFENISLKPGETLAVLYDDLGMLSASISGASVLANRTAESDDDLVVQSGDYNPLLISTDGDATAEFKARGVYL